MSRTTHLRPRPAAPSGHRRLLIAVATTAMGTALLASALPAQAGALPAAPVPAVAPRTAVATAGLFGASDPTYDGAYRQGLAITGLVAAKAGVPAAAVTWLQRQQCADGGFEPFRADLAAPCHEGDPVAFTGKDTNSTALAALAFIAVGQNRRASLSLAWLRRAQNRDGGFPYIVGGASDSNSTGLVLAALRAAQMTPDRVTRTRRGTSAALFLARLQISCPAAAALRGGIAYQASDTLTPNDLATSQAALGALSTIPVARVKATKAPAYIRCVSGRAAARRAVGDAAAGYLARALDAGHGTLPNAFGPGTDYSATAWSVLALVAGRTAQPQVRTATRALRAGAGTFAVGSDSHDAPGALGLLLLVAGATASDSRSFGGVDLVARLLASRRA